MNLCATATKLPGDWDDGFGPCDREWKLVRRVEATLPSGAASTIYVRRLPARFFRLTCGDISVTTGSGDGVANLIERLARFLSLGALGFRFAGSEIKLVALFGKGRRVRRAPLP